MSGNQVLIQVELDFVRPDEVILETDADVAAEVYETLFLKIFDALSALELNYLVGEFGL